MRLGHTDLCLILLAAATLLTGQAATPPRSDGSALFARECATCHDGGEGSRAPNPAVLRQRSPEAILFALTAGSMRAQGSHLSGVERRAVAEYLTGKIVGGDVTGSAMGRCTASPPFPDPRATAAWIGWGPDASNARYQHAEQAGLTAEDVPKLALKWALGFPDATSAWSQPTLIGGRLFVGSHNGTVFSLEAKSGCIHWTFSAKSSVRTAITIGPRGSGYAVYFGDSSANAYALDAKTGALIWTRRIEAHPYARITASPAVYRERVYIATASYEEIVGADPSYECCTFRGSVTALDAKTGVVAWQTFLVPEPKPRGTTATGATLWGPSGAGSWAAPTVDAKRGVLYVATGNTYTAPQLPTSDAVVAMDLATGAIKWTNQVTPNDVYISGCRPGIAACADEVGPDFDFGNSPMLATLPHGKQAIVIGQKSGVGWAMDPDNQGKVLWQYRAGQGGALGGMEWGSAVDDERAYFPVSDILAARPGGLHAVDLNTGRRVWYVEPPPAKCGAGRGCNGALAAAITVIPGIVFSGSNDGALRAYSAKDGSLIWEYDTNREFETLNGVKARGASMHGAGPTIAGGMVYVNSGYGDHGGRPGNVLLAFGLP